MEETTVTKIPFEINRIPDNTRFVGEEIVVQDGVNGTHTVTTVDGHVTSSRTVAPKNSVVYYGISEREDVSTHEPPQEEIKKHTPENVEVNEDSFIPTKSPKSHQPQGRLSQTKEIFNVNVTTLKKVALEAGRLLVLAIPGILITVLTDNPGLGGSVGATILLVLKSLDRGIHEDKSTASTGILPF